MYEAARYLCLTEVIISCYLCNFKHIHKIVLDAFNAKLVLYKLMLNK